MNPEALLSFVLEEAQRAGATAADALMVGGRSTTVRVRLGQTETVKQSRDKGVGLRVFVGSRSATTSTSDFDKETLSRLIARTVQAAGVTAEDPFAGLPPEDLLASPAADTLDLYDPTLDELTVERALELAKACEAAALGVDARLDNSEGAEMSWGFGETHLANSLGVYLHKKSTSASLWATPVASDNGDKQRDYWWTSARHFADLDAPEVVGLEAARRTLRRLGARKPETCQVPVILEAPVASRFLGTLAGAINGGALYRDASYLCGKLNEAVASANVTVVDDPHIVRGPSSRMFDAEGLPTQKTTIVDRGVLRSYLLDTYTAKKLSMASTRGARRSLTGTPSPGSSNFWMKCGPYDQEALIASVKRGLLITETVGFGVSTVTGDYSQGAVGLWIEDGAIAYPVNELTIASTLPKMWTGIDMVGNDRDPRRGTSAPSLRLAQMTVAGT